MFSDNIQFTETDENIKTAKTYMLKALSLLYPRMYEQLSVALEQRIQSANVIYFDRNDEHSIMIPIVVDHNLLTEICVPKNNKTIDFVPFLCDSQIIKIHPVLLLDRQASQFTVIHEMCHLLSIGDYIISGSEVYHKFGTISFLYRIINDELQLRECIGNKTENENITNAITESILKIIDEGIIETSATGRVVENYFL